MLAVHFENLLFLLFIAVAFLFQLLTRAASKAGKGPDETTRRSTSIPPPTPRGSTETDEERVRKFLEALGQPPGTKPPPPVVHRTDIPPRPVAPVRPPPVMFPSAAPRPLTREERAKRAVILHERPTDKPGDWLRKLNQPNEPEIKPRRPFVPKSAEPIAFEVHAGMIPTGPSAIIQAPSDAYATATQPVAGPKEMELNILAMLKSTSGLRGAIILREVFGPPRSLQPLELV